MNDEIFESRRDEYKNTQDSIVAANSYDWSSREPGLWMAQAQVHATLYLAEQQRIANLIAISMPREDVMSNSGLANDWTRTREEIRKVLGL